MLSRLTSSRIEIGEAKMLPNATHSLHLFGMPCIRDADANPLSLRGRKSIALLGFLVLTYPQAHSRERLVGLFWPELSNKDARNNLRVCVSRINNTLRSANGSVLTSTRLTIAFNPGSELICDVTEFQRLMSEVAEHSHADPETCHECDIGLMQAVRICTAEFMEGFFLDDCEDFDEWQYGIRAQLQTAAVTTIKTLVRRAVSASDFVTVEHLSRQLLRLDPYSEEAHRHLMTAMVCDGDQKAALAHYSLLKKKLKTELGAVPDEATQKLVLSIEAGELTAADEHRKETEGYLPVVTAPLNNLPVEKSPYIGNRIVLAKLFSYLEEQRLVTLVGIGGVGKTRLAVQLGQSLQLSYPGGVWFVRLASMNSRVEMLSSLATVLGVQLLPGDEAIDSICNQLDDRKRLLILDNFEHLLTESDVVSSLLEHVLNLTILVTSRSRLQLTEEAVYQVQGLSYVSTEKTTVGNPATGDDASELFIDVARRTLAAFNSKANNRDIRQIVYLVKGHPLAIVMAASWVDGLSCRQIIEELKKGLSILETEANDVPERQRSIRATFKYSWTLLDCEEQALFSVLSIFRGGFDKHAAYVIAGASFQNLTRLVRKSLLQYYPDRERYEMHELMRQYAEEQLDNLGLRRKATAAHGKYYFELLNQISSGRFEADAALQQRRFNEEYNNVCKAWYFAVSEKNHQALIKAISDLRIMCSLGSHSHDLLELLQPVIPMVENPDNDKRCRNLTLNILLAMGFAYRYTNGYFARELGDIFSRAYALTDELESSPELFVVLYGRWSFNFTSGNLLNNAPVLSQWHQRITRLKSEGQTLPYVKDAEFVIHMLEGPQLQCMGELARGRQLIQAGLKLEDTLRHAAIMGNYGLNFAVSGRHWLAINQCIAGLVNQSTQTIMHAQNIAERENNPYLRIFIAFGQLTIAVIRQDIEQIYFHASAVKALVSEHRIFQAFQHHADIYTSYARGYTEGCAGLEKLKSLIDSDNGIPIFRLFDVQLFADLLVRSGNPKEAVKYLHTYTDRAEKRKILFCIVESFRIEADALCAIGDLAKARECYEKAMSIAVNQQAGLYKLRVGHAYALYLDRLHLGDEAKALLLPVIDALPECCDTADFATAKAVLTSLNTSS
ncbi:MAG: BTAD domain-containing putative transcriptional regulator [Granulosicoccus sp.]